MTYKVVLDNVGSGYNLATINANFKKIEDILNRFVLWRDNPDGTANTVKDDIDFNGKHIYNLPEPVHLSNPVRMVDLVAALQGVDVSTIPIPPLAPPPVEPPAPPDVPVVANFSVSGTAGIAPYTVTFTNLSEGGATEYAWDFENNGSVDSTSVNPTYTYTTPGSYSVKLTATRGSDVGVETKAALITVTSAPPGPPPPAPSPSPSPPVVDFYANQTSGTAPLTVTFTDNSTNSPTSYAWDVDNNGTTDYTTNPATHTYTAPGTYSVKLTANNSTGSGNMTKASYITVSSPPVPSSPVADFVGTPTYGEFYVIVNFTDLSTGNPTSWAWNFGNGQTSTLKNPTVVFNGAGEYTVTLTATNAGGSSTMQKTSYITVSGYENPGGA